MRLTEIDAPEFNLAVTLNSGQVFHWQSHKTGFIGAIGEGATYVEQRGSKLRIHVERGAPRRANSALQSGTRQHFPSIADFVAHYFALDHPLKKICASFPDEPPLNAARQFCRGLRIIRQPRWECLATFICSSMKQVAHIRQISRALRQRFGKRRRLDGENIFVFPTARRLSQTSNRELQRCAVGYRADYLRATARLVDGGDADLDQWTSLSDAELRTNLCELPGVGVKVANCVMLFAYERINAFPIDVWIGRVLRENYFGQRKVNDKELAQFAADHFGSFGGYAQQYLFHHARLTKR